MTTTIAALRCENLENPLGIDALRPRLAWQLVTPRRGAGQSAYRIEVASSPQELAANAASLWDSGQIQSDQTSQIEYAGPPLHSGQRAYWRVSIWDETGAFAGISEAARWEMGLLEAGDWQAAWIAAPWVGGPRTGSPCPHLRSTFNLEELPQRARLYVTALGLYEFHLNGAKVGNDAFTPGWTDYKKRLLYQSYDITEMLTMGDNAVGAILGDGWYCGHVQASDRQQYGDRPALRAQLVLEFASGERRVITSNESWRAGQGALLQSDIIAGESFDARLKLKGWATSSYDDSNWQRATAAPAPNACLVAQSSPPVRLTQELTPVSSTPAGGLYWGFHGRIYDMGQNMVGAVRLRAAAPVGTTLTFRFGEILDENGHLYVENLRSAAVTDYYTFSGEGEETWQPRFTFHGFRYVEVVTQANYELPEGSLTGLVYHSDYQRSGHFECSDALVNQLQSNINWGWRGNSLDIPTDCPQRDERLGWTGDAQVFAATAAYNWDVNCFFSRWQRDLRDSQAQSGSIPMVVPSVLGDDGGPAWADAVLILPWTLYRFYGDKRLLEENYDVFTRFAQFLFDTSQGNLRCYEGMPANSGFGDWLAQDGSDHGGNGTPRELIGTAFHAHAADLMSQIATVLDKPEDAKMYAERFGEIRKAFNERFVTPVGLVSPGTQTACLLALHFKLLAEGNRASALAQLAEDVERHGTHLTSGFVGSSYLNPVLSRGGYNELAYKLLAQPTWPSWLYAVTQGATTIWERWDGWTQEKGFADAGMNSFNHYAYGAIGEWLYANVAGLDVEACSPGFKEITLRPQPGGSLTYAKASYQSPQGLIESHWSINEGRFDWSVTVPPNCRATLVLPGTGPITESGQPIAQVEHLELFDNAEGAQKMRAKAGTYRLSVALSSSP